MNVNTRINGIAAKLELAAKRGLEPFGIEGHRYRLQPTLSENEVQQFEARWRVQLPAEYRAFITSVANGGAGPAYGMFPLESALAYQRVQIPEDFLSCPFPYNEPYNPYEDPELAAFFKREQDGKLDKGEFERTKLHETLGTLVLCHEGCGHLHLLVVTGQERGRMWLDGTASDGGYIPLGVNFLDWYEAWLDNTSAGSDGLWWMIETGINTE